MKPGQSAHDDYDAIILLLHGGAFDGAQHCWRGPTTCVPRSIELDDGSRLYRYVMPASAHTLLTAGGLRCTHLYLAETLTGGAPDIPQAIEPTQPAAPPTLGGWLRNLLTLKVRAGKES